MVRDLGQVQILNRMTERPVADVVQQRGGKEQLGVSLRHGGIEPGIGCEPVQVFNRRQKNAQRMFQAGMSGRGIDQPHQT